MRFGRWEVSEGLRLAHTLQLSDGAVFKKGRCLDPEDVERLHRDGIAWVWAAQLDPQDLDEDRAAAQLAQVVAGSGTRPAEASTGRCNLHAEAAGLLVLAVDAVKSLNHLSADLTLATLPPFSVVRVGTMVATIKVIPFAVPQSLLDSAQSLAGSSGSYPDPHRRFTREHLGPRCSGPAGASGANRQRDFRGTALCS